MYHNVYICRNKNREIMTEYLELKDKANANFMQSKTRGDIRFHLLVLLALETATFINLPASEFVKDPFVKTPGSLGLPSTKSKRIVCLSFP